MTAWGGQQFTWERSWFWDQLDSSAAPGSAFTACFAYSYLHTMCASELGSKYDVSTVNVRRWSIGWLVLKIGWEVCSVMLNELTGNMDNVQVSMNGAGKGRLTGLCHALLC